IYPMSEEKILLVVNAGNMEKDWMWVNENSEGFDIQLKNVTEDFSQIAIQGPKVINHIEKILGFDVKSMSFMTFGVLPYQDGHIIVSRTGYTGEDGFEIYGHHHLVENLWDNAINEKAVPCGLGARDTLRFEANLPLYGHEISESINPIEAGLGFAVKLDKHFIGRDALLHAKENLSRKTVGIELLEKGIPRHGYDIYAEDKKVGFITTGYMLPTQEKPIAVAMVEIDYAELGTQLYVVIRQNKVLARVRNKKFYTKNYKK
ncbi:MAG: glycine cleavage system aminomethyltransferase GcvT, partial [Acholeplasmataceae bacterium]|nr:glycine cleavage system aminomethyltransferase GcvT [Acholeplasmataceae bacterium]